MEDKSFEVFDTLRSQIVKEQNILRANPANYIPIIESYLKMIKENILYKPDSNPIQLKEGHVAFTEAIDFLKTAPIVKPLTLETRLTQPANEFAKYLGEGGLVTTVDKDGLNASDRIEKYAEWDIACGENIEFCSKNSTARDIIVSLLVDDGAKSRGHRRNLLAKELNYIGVGIFEHTKYGMVVVIDYVGGIRNKGQPFFDYKNFKYQYPPADAKKKPKSLLQQNDEDAPDNAISCGMSKKTSDVIYEGKVRRVNRKIYEMKDGTKHIVEYEIC